MKVYKFKCIANYGGGEAIVVANSNYEAYGLLIESNSYYGEVFSVKSCEELITLWPNVNEPTIISVEYYTE